MNPFSDKTPCSRHHSVLRALQEENTDLHQNLLQTVVCIESLESELQRTREELSAVKEKYKRFGILIKTNSLKHDESTFPIADDVHAQRHILKLHAISCTCDAIHIRWCASIHDSSCDLCTWCHREQLQFISPGDPLKSNKSSHVFYIILSIDSLIHGTYWMPVQDTFSPVHFCGLTWLIFLD